MPKIKFAEDTVPIAEFKKHAWAMIRKLHANRRPLVITQNGKPAAVMLTPAAYEELGGWQLVKAKVQAGIDSAALGPAVPSSEVRRRLKAIVDET